MNSVIVVDTLGYVGTGILGITMFPQVYKTFTEKKANDLSLGYLLLQFSANILFIMYGYFIQSFPVIISNCIVFVCTFSLIYAKYRYKDYIPIIGNDNYV
ncbi:PQ-loop domain-containing transporter [Flavobacteriaceae bacterium]|nr:PQ-loop domain-containing transporter [Flavobacteriaceae bacterium]